MLSCLQSNLRTCLAQRGPGALLGTKITRRQRDGSAKQLLNRVLELAKTSPDYSVFSNAPFLFVRNEKRCSTPVGWVFCLCLNLTGSETGLWKTGTCKQWRLEVRRERSQRNYSYEKIRCLTACEPYLRSVTRSPPDMHHHPTWHDLSGT